MTNCSSSGCEAPHYALGLCSVHWRQAKRAEDPGYGRGSGKCTVADCSARVDARGLCAKHYAAWKRANGPRCATGCGRAASGHGLCSMHLKRLAKTGTLDAPRPSVWSEGAGYLYRYDPSHPLADAKGRLGLHRESLHTKIGAGAHPCNWCATILWWGVDLDVDHLDWDVTNNAPENLVAACHSCNSARQQRRAVPHAHTPVPQLCDDNVPPQVR